MLSGSSSGASGPRVWGLGGISHARSSSRSGSYITVSPGSRMVLTNGASAANVFWCANSYVALGPGSSSVGTFIANDYVALTNAAVSGSVFSLNAGMTLTVSAVRLPSPGPFSLPGSTYNTPVNLGSAGSFAVLGGSAVVNTGPSSVAGNVGCYPGTADQISVRHGLWPGVLVRCALPQSHAQGASLNGVDFGSGAESANAQADLAVVFAGLRARSATPIPSALDSSTFYPGVYASPTYITLGGQLTLDAQGDAGAIWVFVSASYVTVGPGSQMVLINGARASNGEYTGAAKAPTVDQRFHSSCTMQCFGPLVVTSRSARGARASARSSRTATSPLPTPPSLAPSSPSLLERPSPSRPCACPHLVLSRCGGLRTTSPSTCSVRAALPCSAARPSSTQARAPS